MVKNPVQFAVVREDPLVEAALLERLETPRRALLIASGGCTALSLAALFPGLAITLLDANAAQLDLVRRKAEALGRADPRERRRLFDIGERGAGGLNSCGNFESLFRSFRELVFDLVVPYDELRRAFEDRTIQALAAERIFPSRFWRAAFDMHFCDSFLEALFGPAATQHAPKGSYPGYFRAALERGLAGAGAPENYFLHHILLGHYLDRPAALPPYLREPPRAALDFEYVHGRLADMAGAWSAFDFVHLSNIFDWSEEAEVAAVARALAREARPGAAVCFRQLNNASDFAKHFADAFRFDEELGGSLLARDRSLFYCRINAGARL
jgi:S-adenosylmethionine-diacylglycerol 3-amino-3-carboxypropyl transferase